MNEPYLWNNVNARRGERLPPGEIIDDDAAEVAYARARRWQAAEAATGIGEDYRVQFDDSPRFEWRLWAWGAGAVAITVAWVVFLTVVIVNMARAA